MARIDVDDDLVVLALRPWEKAVSLSGDVRVPLSSVVDVVVLDDGPRVVKGLRAPGFAVGSTKVGTWRRWGSRSFVVVRGSGPVVHVRLRGGRYDELLVSTPDPELVVERVRAAQARRSLG